MCTNLSVSSFVSLAYAGRRYTGSLAPPSSTHTTASDPDPEILHALNDHNHVQIQPAHPDLAHIGSFLGTVDTTIPTGMPEELMTAASSSPRTVINPDGIEWINVDRPWPNYRALEQWMTFSLEDEEK